MSLYASYVAFTAAVATLVGVGALVSVVVLSRREGTFLATTYRVWLVVAALLCVVAPLLFRLGSSGNISLSDAYLLQKRQYFHAGWGRVLVAYSMFAGLVLGGLFAAVARRK